MLIKETEFERSQSGPIAFALNPLLSEIVLWNDADICDARPLFKKIEVSARVAWICAELATRGVATVLTEPSIVWIPTEEIEQQSGGSNIASLTHFRLDGCAPQADMRRFQKVMRKQFDRRLDFIIRKSVAAFQSVNAGFTRIDGTNGQGLLRFALTEAGKLFVTNSRPR